MFFLLENLCNVTITHSKYVKAINGKSSEKNRFQNSLTVSNIMISNIVTDIFGKTSKSILELILSKEDNVTLEEITPLLRKNLKATPEQILESVQGNLTHQQNSKMKVCLTPQCNESAGKKNLYTSVELVSISSHY